MPAFEHNTNHLGWVIGNDNQVYEAFAGATSDPLGDLIAHATQGRYGACAAMRHLHKHNQGYFEREIVPRIPERLELSHARQVLIDAAFDHKAEAKRLLNRKFSGERKVPSDDIYKHLKNYEQLLEVSDLLLDVAFGFR
jgi:hypothetical protein